MASTPRRRCRARWALPLAACGAKVILNPRAWLCPGSHTAAQTMSPTPTAMQLTRAQLGSEQRHAAGSVQLEAVNNGEEHLWRSARTTDQLASTLVVATAVVASPTLCRRSLAAARACRTSLLHRHAVTSETVEKVETTESTVGEGKPSKPEKEEEQEFEEVEEVAGDDPLVQALEERLRKQNGNDDLTLDMVLNPGTIVNTEREVIRLKAKLLTLPEEDTTARKELEDRIEQKQMKIVTEMRQVMTDQLKLEFLIQAILSIPFFASLCYGTFPWEVDLRAWDIDLVVTRLAEKLFGLWGIWLVTVPALRARKPGGPYGMGYEEKRALDIAFLVLPFVCIFVPFFDKYPPVTFWVSFAILVGLYVWSFSNPYEEESRGFARRGVSGSNGLPEPVAWVLRTLDYSTGQERGADSEDAEWLGQIDSYDKAAEELVAAQKAKGQTKDQKQDKQTEAEVNRQAQKA